MGIVGFIHFFSSIILSIDHHKLAYINPYRLINIERFLGNTTDRDWFFALGWIFFLSLIAVIYYRLTKPEKNT